MMNVSRSLRVDNDRKSGGVLPLVITFLALSIACVVFAILCIYSTKIAFLASNRLLFSLLAGGFMVEFFILCVWFVIRAKETWYKSALSGLILTLFALIVLFILQKTGFFNVIQNQNTLQEYLESKGAWMPVVYTVLQFLQVVVLPIPSVVSTLAGVALFGAFQTMIYSLIGVLLGSFTGFLIGRKLGGKAVSWMIGIDTLNKWQRKIKGKDYLLLTLMFILPVFPDDVLCFIAGLSTMTLRYFSIMIVFSRLLQISITCYSIDLIPFTTWWGLSIWVAFFLAILVGFLFVYRNIDKIQRSLSKRLRKTGENNLDLYNKDKS